MHIPIVSHAELGHSPPSRSKVSHSHVTGNSAYALAVTITDMYRRVPTETREEILGRVKEGMTVADAASQYGVSTKTIYTWLAKEARPEISVLEYNRLKRENEELKRIIGILTLEMERGKKNSGH